MTTGEIFKNAPHAFEDIGWSSLGDWLARRTLAITGKDPNDYLAADAGFGSKVIILKEDAERILQDLNDNKDSV